VPRRERGFSEVIIDIFSLHRGPVPVLFALPSSPLRLNAANRWAPSPSPSPRTAVRLKPDSGGGCSENTCRLVGTRPSNSRGGTFAASTIRTKRLFTPLGGSAMRRRFFTSFSRASWDQQSSGLLEHVSRGEWPSTPVLRSAPPRSAGHLSRCFERSESDVIQHHHRLTSFLKGPPRPSFVALLIRAQPHLRHGSSTCSFEQVSSNPSFQSGRSKWWALSPIAPRPHQRL